jgi:hypothetical protein
MARHFETLYRMKNGVTPLSDSYFNPLHLDVDLRLHGLEEVKADWENAVADISGKGLERIDAALLPAFERVQQLADFGFLVAQADSTSPVTFVVGWQQLSIPAGPTRDLFRPTPFIVLTRQSNLTDWAIARTDEYIAATGLLSFEVLTVSGDSGPHTDVWVGASASGAIITQQAVSSAQESASIAAMQAGIATTQAGIAMTQAGIASGAATSASASLASMNGVYRGSGSSAPASPAGGQLWFDTGSVPNVFRVYDAVTSAWVPTVTTSIGGIIHEDFVATSGQTIFTVPGGFTKIDVFLNGVQLASGSDYTESSPTVTLSTGVTAGHVVQIRGYLSNDATDFYTKGQTDTKLAAKAASSHSHAIGDVVNLPTVLGSKSEVGHTHIASDVTDLATALGAKAGFYSGSTRDALDLPVGSIVMAIDYTVRDRNVTTSVWLDTSATYRYTTQSGSAGTLLVGNWKARGGIQIYIGGGYPYYNLFQRVS